MKSVTVKSKKINKTCLNSFLAMFFILLCSISLSAHDLGVSSISLEIKDGKLVVYSSYARADFDAVIKFNDAEDFKAFTRKAVAVEVDGKSLEVLDNDVLSDNADSLNLRHSFGEVSGEQIKITSFLPPKLSSNHIQILKLIRNDKEISRQFLTGDNNAIRFQPRPIANARFIRAISDARNQTHSFRIRSSFIFAGTAFGCDPIQRNCQDRHLFYHRSFDNFVACRTQYNFRSKFFGRADHCRFDNLCRLGKHLQNRTKKALADRVYFRFGSRFGFCVRFAGNRNRRGNFKRDAASVV